jgi:hypothetical protein
VGNKADRAEFQKMLSPEELTKLEAETKEFDKDPMIESVADLEFGRLASRVYRSGWRDSYGTFDQGSPMVFLSAIPPINQRGMREEFWGWYDVNQLLFDRFREAERLGHRATGLVLKRLAVMARRG